MVKPVFCLDSIQFFQHRLRKQPQKQEGGHGVHQIHRHALHIISDQQLPAGGGLIHQHSRRVHHAAVNQKGADKAEQGQRKPISAQQTLAEQHTGQQADDAKEIIRGKRYDY